MRRWTAKAQTSLCLRTVSPGLSLFAQTIYGTGESLRPRATSPVILSVCACARVWKIKKTLDDKVSFSWVGSTVNLSSFNSRTKVLAFGWSEKQILSPTVIYIWPFQGVASVVVILIVNFRPLSVCLWLTVQFLKDSLVAICWERPAPLAFHLCFFYFSTVLIVSVPLPVWCLGQDVEFDCIGSWSMPFLSTLLNFNTFSWKMYADT